MALPATAPESERPSRYKVNATALHALLEAEKPAYVVFTNPAERLAYGHAHTVAAAHQRLVKVETVRH